jgi:hypothetical protein
MGKISSISFLLRLFGKVNDGPKKEVNPFISKHLAGLYINNDIPVYAWICCHPPGSR